MAFMHGHDNIATDYTASLHWLALCPLLPACAGPLRGATLMLAVGATAMAVDVVRRLPAHWLDARLAAVVVAAGLAGLSDLVLRAAAPSLHDQVAAALPLLALVGLLPPPRHDDGASLLRRLLPAMLLVWLLACLHALIDPATLAGEWRLLSGDAAPAPQLPWRSPAASLIGLALLLAAANAARAGIGRRRAP